MISVKKKTKTQRMISAPRNKEIIYYMMRRRSKLCLQLQKEGSDGQIEKMIAGLTSQINYMLGHSVGKLDIKEEEA